MAHTDIGRDLLNQFAEQCAEVANMDKSGALIASQATLAKLMETSTATTKRALSVLIEQAWIQTIRLGSDRGGALAYVAQRYKVSADAVRPVFEAAQLVGRVFGQRAERQNRGSHRFHQLIRRDMMIDGTSQYRQFTITFDAGAQNLQ